MPYLWVMKEFNIPLYPPPRFPEKTHIDKDGRLWFSCWTLIGFLEEYNKMPTEENGTPEDVGALPIPKKKSKEIYHSAV